jgi:hypothetical protein
MSRLEKPSRFALSPRQAVLIGVLAIVLVVVLVVQFGGGSGAEETACAKAAAKTATGPKRSSRAPKRRPASPATVRRQPSLPPSLPPWPRFELSEVLEFDPFQAPPALRRQSKADQAGSVSGNEEIAAVRDQRLRQIWAEHQQALEKLQQQGVRIIVGSPGKGRAAVIGNRTVRVGDTLDRFRVMAIEPDGVVIQQPEIEDLSEELFYAPGGK